MIGTRISSLSVKITFASVLLVCSVAASGIVIHVDANAPGANDGTSWEDAYNYMQDALVEANSLSPPVEIRVAGGTYKPDQGGGQPLGGRSCSFGL